MNINTNSVLYLFLFILPGAFSKILRRRFAPVHLSTEKNKSTLIETSEIVVISAVVFCLNNVVIVAYRWWNEIPGRFDAIENFSRMDFLVQYVILTLITTMLFTYLFYYFDRKIVNRVINWNNDIHGNPKEAEVKTLWEEIFETDTYLNSKKQNVVVAIEKDGKILSRGILRDFPAPITECDDLILCNCEEIEEYFRIDATRPFEQRYFQRTAFEYTILSKGVTLKFYDTTRYLDFLAAPDQTPEWITSVSEVLETEQV